MRGLVASLLARAARGAPRRRVLVGLVALAAVACATTAALTAGGLAGVVAAPIAVDYSVWPSQLGLPGPSGGQSLGEGQVVVDSRSVDVQGYSCATIGGRQQCTVAGADKVTLSVNGDFIDSRTVDVDGGFRFAHVALQVGQNTVEVSANRIYGWRPLTASRIVTVYVEPRAPAVPRLAAAPSIVNAADLTVRGSADPHVAVIVQLYAGDAVSDGGQATRSPMRTAQVLTDPLTGLFAARVSLYPPAAYALTVRAATRAGTTSQASRPLRVTYDPTYVRPGEAPAHRHLDISLATTKVHAGFDVTLPRDDDRGRNLLTGTISPQQFFQQVFGPMSVDAFDMAGLFQGVQPQRTLTADTLHVTAQSNPELEGVTLTRSFSLHVEEGDYLSRPEDSLSLHVDDYHLISVDPEPATFAGPDATWRGPLEITEPTVKAEVALDPASSPLTVVRLRPYDVIPWPASAPIGLLYAVMNSVALVWYLWLCRQHDLSRWLGSRPARRLERLCRWLVAFCFVPVTADLARNVPGYLAGAHSLGRLLPQWVAKLTSEPVRQSLVALLIAGLVGTLVSAVLKRWVEQRALFWLWSFGRGITVALWLTAALYGLIVLWWDQPLFVDYRYVAWLFTAVFVMAIAVSVTTMALTVRALTRCGPRPAGWRRLVLLVVAVGAAAVSWPVATTAFNAGSTLGGSDNVAVVVGSVFQVIQYDAAFVVLIAAAAVLRRPAGESDQGLELSLGRLVFANLVVSIDPYLLGIPVSFLLGLLLFRSLLLPQADRDALGVTSGDVRARRQAALDRLHAQAVADELEATLEELQKKVAAGELMPHEVARRRRRLEAHVARRQRNTPVAAGVSTRRFVLAFGPKDGGWENGVYAARLGLLIAVPWLTLYFSVFAFRAGQLSTPIIPMVVMNNLLTEPLLWIVQSFFFGYFFSIMRGHSGLQKGLWMAVIVAICQLPEWVTSFRTPPEAVSTLLGALVTVMSLPILGLIFDLRTVKDGLGDGFTWAAFARLTGIGGLTASASLVVASFGIGLTTILNGAFVHLMDLFLQAAGVPITAGH